MRRLLILVLVATLAVILLQAPVKADSLETRSGKVITGEYLGGTYATVRFKTNGLVKVYDLDQVSVLVFERGQGAGAQVGAGHAITDSSGITTQTITPAAQPQTAVGAGSGISSGGLYASGTGAVGASTGQSAGLNQAGGPAPTITIPPGLVLKARISQAVSSSRNGVGDRFIVLLENNISVFGVSVVPRGTKAYGRVVSVRRASRKSGGAELTLELTDMNIGGRTTSIITDRLGLNTDSRGMLRTSGGAGVESGSVTITPGKQIMIGSGSVIEFVLRQPLVFQAR